MARDPEAPPDESGAEPPEAVEIPIDGVLDLHSFAPREIPDLVATYLDECRARGILQVRLIHGKGTGTQRRIVQGVLEKDPAVSSFRTADERAGGWGATLVELKPL
jgi:dsDNA-specific endonuclease/ATPase MutS2